jgi:hypothetical protein
MRVTSRMMPRKARWRIAIMATSNTRIAAKSGERRALPGRHQANPAASTRRPDQHQDVDYGCTRHRDRDGGNQPRLALPVTPGESGSD